MMMNELQSKLLEPLKLMRSIIVGPITENNGRLNVEPSNFQDILVMIFLNDSDR